jgi:hypothetical protein
VDSERYFVGSVGDAYIVSSRRYASFYFDSHHFQKLFDGGWENTTVRLEIIAYLARSYVEVSDWEFDRTEKFAIRAAYRPGPEVRAEVERVHVWVNPPLFLTSKCGPAEAEEIEDQRAFEDVTADEGDSGEPFDDDGDPATEAFYRSQLTAARNLQHPNPIDAKRSALKRAEAAATVTPTCSDSMADAARRISAAAIRQKFDTIDRFSREIFEHVAELDRIGWPAVRGNEREAFVDLTKRIEAWKKGWNW